MKESDFWAGGFGDEYINRNNSEKLYQSNVEFFRKALPEKQDISDVIELGANIGLNLRAISDILPWAYLVGVEINEKAYQQMAEIADISYCCNLFDSRVDNVCDLAFTKGVLIHIHPDDLQAAYKRLFDLSRHYILICEYYSPKPVEIEYRGETGKLWKRDFAGEMMDAYPLRLVDYGFVYHRDKLPQDDITWFLMEKTS